MTHRHEPLDPSQFPTLAGFAAGYLHEDFIVEHGNRDAAREAFLRDADPDERKRFDEEADRFLRTAARYGWRDVAAAFGRFGGAWRPATRAALASLLRPSGAAHPGAHAEARKTP